MFFTHSLFHSSAPFRAPRVCDRRNSHDTLEQSMGVARAAHLVLLGIVGSAQAENASECKSLGFAPSLYCSSCDKLSDLVSATDPLVNECKGCCTPDPEKGSFASATFDVCK
jgi:hypothetical protein